jgi:hypothetical protein
VLTASRMPPRPDVDGFESGVEAVIVSIGMTIASSSPAKTPVNGERLGYRPQLDRTGRVRSPAKTPVNGERLGYRPQLERIGVVSSPPKLPGPSYSHP